MRISPVRVAVLGSFVAALASAPATAHEVTVRGLVLAVDRAHARVVVRVERAASLPAATLSFAYDPRRKPVPRAGATITADTDLDAAPPKLSRVAILRAPRGLVAAATQAPLRLPAGVLRAVPHVNVGDPLPDAPFLDQRGRPFALRALRGAPLVLAFVYTRCRDNRVCPLISAKFAKLQGAFAGGPERLVEVSLDPAFDKPAVLRAYGVKFDADPARWRLLTGDPERVLDFAARFGVTAFPEPRLGLIHAERTVLVDRDGVIRDLIDETSWTPQQIVAQVRAEERLASNPLQRFDLWLSSAAVALCGNAVAGFSGLLDLAIVLAIFGGFGFVFYRIGRALYRSA